MKMLRPKSGSERAWPLVAALPRSSTRERAHSRTGTAPLKGPGTRFPKFVTRLRVFASELRNAKGTSKPVIPVPLCDLKFLIKFAARDAGTSNRRH
jgi:hypothetical protein